MEKHIQLVLKESLKIIIACKNEMDKKLSG